MTEQNYYLLLFPTLPCTQITHLERKALSRREVTPWHQTWGVILGALERGDCKTPLSIYKIKCIIAFTFPIIIHYNFPLGGDCKPEQKNLPKVWNTHKQTHNRNKTKSWGPELNKTVCDAQIYDTLHLSLEPREYSFDRFV